MISYQLYSNNTPIHTLSTDELNSIVDDNERQRRLVELNVIEQCLNIFKTAVVQRKRVETYGYMNDPSSRVQFVEPRVHAYCYDPKTGQLKKLEVNFKEYIDDLGSVYDLYQVENPRASSSYPVLDKTLSNQDQGSYGKL